MELEFVYNFELITKEEVEASMGDYNIELPHEYRNFLLRYNGGKPLARRFKTQDGKQSSSIMLFFPLSEHIDPNLLSEYKELTDEDLILPNLLPIGNDPIENKICISLSGDDRGFIYYWSLDMEDIDEDDFYPSYKNVSLIAKSFSEFINGLSTS